MLLAFELNRMHKVKNQILQYAMNYKSKYEKKAKALDSMKT